MSDMTRDEIKSAVAEAVMETGVLTDAEVRRIVKESVRETLILSGIDPDDARATADDMRFVREWRQTRDQIKQKGLVALVGLLIAGIFGLLVLGFKEALKH